jgi:hypothetical protein
MNKRSRWTVAFLMGVAIVVTVISLALFEPAEYLAEAGEATQTVACYGAPAALVLATILLIVFGLAGKRRAPVGGVVVALAFVAALVTVGILIGLAVTEATTPAPTGTPAPTNVPLEISIQIAADSQGSAEEFVWTVYDESDKRRVAFKRFCEEMGEEQATSLLTEPADPGEIEKVEELLRSAGVTQTQVVTLPTEALRHTLFSVYSVELDGEIGYLGGTDLYPDSRMEWFSLPPMTIADGEPKMIAEARTLVVITHRHPAPPEWGETGRDLWKIAGLLMFQ